MSKKRILLTIIGILFAVIIISLAINLLLLKYNVVSIIDVTLGTDKVIISRLAKQQLDEIYIPMPNIEIPVCLGGEIKKEGIRIDNIEKAVIVKSTAKNVTYVRCPTRIANKLGNFKVIGTIHNHPNFSCMLSSQDIETYVSDLRNHQEIIALYCGDYIFFVLSKMSYNVEDY